MGQVGEKVKAASTSGRKSTGESSARAASGQSIDWSTTAHGKGYFDGVWNDSPYGPITYGGILAVAAGKGNEAAVSAYEVALSKTGNPGQRRIIEILGPDVFNNAWHYQVNGYGRGSEYCALHTAYPEVVDEIFADIESVLEDFN